MPELAGSGVVMRRRATAETTAATALTTYRYGAASRSRRRAASPGPTTRMVVSVDCTLAVASETLAGPTMRGTNAVCAVSEKTIETLITAATAIR